jgi:hypothetical protein
LGENQAKPLFFSGKLTSTQEDIAMKVTLALLADFANKSADGKLNILGVFSRIFAEKYPAIHPEMKLVVRFEMHPAELGQTKRLQIQLRDEQGKQIFELAGDLTVEPQTGAPSSGEMVHTDSILSLSGLPIDAPGTYEFVILVNGDVKGTVPFKAVVRTRT